MAVLLHVAAVLCALVALVVTSFLSTLGTLLAFDLFSPACPIALVTSITLSVFIACWTYRLALNRFTAKARSAEIAPGGFPIEPLPHKSGTNSD
jgi:hypothetical protein